MIDIERNYNSLIDVLNTLVDPEYDFNLESNNIDWDGLTDEDSRLVQKIASLINN